MSIFDDEVRAGSREIYLEAGTVVSVTPPTGPVITGAHALIDRNATVTDDFGVVLESRCEVRMLVDEVGHIGRGTLVDTSRPDDRWELLEPIGNDTFETRWTAGRA